MRLLVTGGRGFIGQYVVARGHELGYQVETYDIYDGQDILNRDGFGGFVADYEPDAIIHLAGQLGTHELWDTTDLAIDVNIKGALNVAQAAMMMDAKLVSIEQPHIWYNVYEATKFAAKRMLTGLHYDQGLRVEFVTAHNAFGPGQAYGDGHPQKILPTFATKAWLGEPIPVWGDGEQKVNLVYAGSVADVLLDRAAAVHSRPLVEYHAGAEKLVTVNEVAQAVIDYTNSESEIKYSGMRRGEQNIPYPIPGHNYMGTWNWGQLYATIDSYKP